MENPSGSSHNNENGQQRRQGTRPESTLALDFSNALDGAFNLNDEIMQLGSTVQEKKETVKSQSQELEELEARLRATEERLKKVGGQPASTTSGQQESKAASDSAVNPPPSVSTQAPSPRPPAGRQRHLVPASSLADRAPTPLDPRNEPLPGAFPETPYDQQQAADYYDQRRS